MELILLKFLLLLFVFWFCFWGVGGGGGCPVHEKFALVKVNVVDKIISGRTSTRFSLFIEIKLLAQYLTKDYNNNTPCITELLVSL